MRRPLKPSTEINPAEQMRQEYLRALSARLWLLPSSKRSEIRQELAAHIDFLILEQQYQGCSPSNATRVALQQVGDPALVGRLLARQWCKENVLMKTSVISLVFLLAVTSIWALSPQWKDSSPFVIQKVQTVALSPAEKHKYKGADTKVIIQVKEMRPLSKADFEDTARHGSFLQAAVGGKYRSQQVISSFERRGESIFISYPVALGKIPLSAGEVIFVAQTTHGKGAFSAVVRE